MKEKKDKPVKKPWGGRFKDEMSPSAERFTSSVQFDQRLYKEDIIGSMAFAKSLHKVGVLSTKEAKSLLKGLQEIFKDIEQGKVKFKKELEDIHMNVEHLLVEKIGDVAKKLHTGRSRNDQVTTDLRMYLKNEIAETINLITKFQIALLDIADKNIKVVMPGYTHMQRAQPVLFSHHIMAYFEMLQRDKERFSQTYSRTDHLPLGSAALSGTSFRIDREALAKELGFHEVTLNSIDAVADRDYVIDYLSAASIFMMHISRLSEELVIWSTYEFGFIEIADAYATGSSIMPQKKNPDIAELARGKTGRVYGNLIALLTIMKGLPLAYNRDVQEDKERLFDTVDTVKSVLFIFEEMVKSIKINADVMKEGAHKGFLTATDLAYYLVRKNVPFRDAHEIVGKIIAYCEDSNMQLDYISIPELRKFSDKFSFDAQTVISVENSIKTKDLIGGTAPDRVSEAIKQGRKKLLKELKG
ncbi:MAG: argininosuccinate lyase [Candidatus Saganbacteria bacterium]|nr:argininosuccinate lyase [Candidatus Saganbacteria bacterium]